MANMNNVELFEEKRQEALATLVKLGVAEYVRDLELYHGRAGEDGKEWSVDMHHKSNGDNIFDIEGVYTGNKSLAEEFADYGVKIGKGEKVELHRIVSTDNDAVIFNDNRIDSLSENEIKEYREAIKVLQCLKTSADVSVKFEYRKFIPILDKIIQRHGKDLIATEYVSSMINELQTSVNHVDGLEQFASDYISAWNTKVILGRCPDVLLDAYEYERNHVPCGEKFVPISREYFAAWCSMNHIVGVKTATARSRVGHGCRDVYFLFDMKKIMTEKQKGLMLSQLIGEYHDITDVLDKMMLNNPRAEKVFFKGSSKEILKSLANNGELKQLYDMPARTLWEGWTVGQHTQAVMDFFDKYYKDDVPERLKPFIKVCLAVHDIGKGYLEANDKGNKAKESYFNLHCAQKVYDELHLAPEYRKIINFVIDDSQKITTDFVMERDEKKVLFTRLRNGCRQAFVNAFGREPSPNEIEGLKNICIIMQECDSGAYTRYANIEENGAIIGGGNKRFDNSFVLNERDEPRLKCFMDEPVKNTNYESTRSL